MPADDSKVRFAAASAATFCQRAIDARGRGDGFALRYGQRSCYSTWYRVRKGRSVASADRGRKDWSRRNGWRAR